MNGRAVPFPAKVMPFLTGYAIIFKWRIVGLLLLVLGVAGISNAGNWFFSRLIGYIKSGAEPGHFETGLIYVGIIGICGIGYVCLNNMTNVLSETRLRVPLTARLNKDLFAYLQGHSYGYITSRQTGVFMQKIEQLQQVRDIFLVLIFYIWQPVAEVLIKTVLLFMINPLLGGVFLICTVAVLLPGMATDKAVKRKSKLSASVAALVNGRITDIVTNISLVKLFSNAEWEQKRLSPLLHQEGKTRKMHSMALFGQGAVTGIAINLMSFGVLVLAVFLWSQGKIGLADIVFVLLTITGGLNALNELIYFIQQIQSRAGTIEKALEPFAAPYEIQDRDTAAALKVVKGKIEFKNVHFAYAGSKPVLSGFNLTLSPHEKVGLVGISGSGKTTLINLLQRAYDIQKGQILVDGQDIAEVTQDSLHQAIGLIPQETALFHRSIADNIAYGKPQAGMDEIRQAACRAFADEFICEKAEGYASLVGERGVKLSGGERQRIAIARAILKDAPVLILDEATSSLDSESEHLIQCATEELLENKTVLAVAHRLSTLKKMDRIIVLENGKIIEEETPEILLKKGGRFAQFWKLQQSGESRNV